MVCGVRGSSALCEGAAQRVCKQVLIAAVSGECREQTAPFSPRCVSTHITLSLSHASCSRPAGLTQNMHQTVCVRGKVTLETWQTATEGIL